jgi:hypothetical protein
MKVINPACATVHSFTDKRAWVSKRLKDCLPGVGLLENRTKKNLATNICLNIFEEI